jgi:uncharacterized membrane protein YfcA
MLEFPISGVTTYWWLPVVVAFFVSVLSSTGGLSGAFLLLPFQVSFLGFVGPAVTPTNLIFNIVAIPSGVFRYYREKRMVWSLAGAIIIATLPGIFIGAIIRIKFLQDPRAFKLFVAAVLLYIGSRLVMDLLRKPAHSSPPSQGELGRSAEPFHVTNQHVNLKTVGYEFEGNQYRVPTWGLMLLSFIVGIIGGTYGIGGGAIIGPFLVAVFRLPVHTTAGASLLGTFISSVAGVAVFALIAPLFASTGLAITPDWALGALFGAGGAVGMYIGARLQRRLSARLIKAILMILLLSIAIRYVVEVVG